MRLQTIVNMFFHWLSLLNRRHFCNSGRPLLQKRVHENPVTKFTAGATIAVSQRLAEQVPLIVLSVEHLTATGFVVRVTEAGAPHRLPALWRKALR